MSIAFPIASFTSERSIRKSCVPRLSRRGNWMLHTREKAALNPRERQQNLSLTANKTGTRASNLRSRAEFLVNGVQMIGKRWLLSGIMAGLAILASVPASAGDIKITIPRHSKLTPVQRLNREGVEAIRQHKYSKAESLFYKAYLLDPDDPFTLNNLGYISEMQGDIDRAQRFYSLAAEQSSDAVIDRASP